MEQITPQEVLKLNLPKLGDIETKVLISSVGHFTITRLECTHDERHYSAEGIARRNHIDKPSSLGLNISMGRAIKALKKKLRGEKIHNHYMA